MKACATISEKDANLFLVTDKIDEVVRLIPGKSINEYGLTPVSKQRPLRWLFKVDNLLVV